MIDEIEDDVLEVLHQRSNICNGADTCEARGAISPLVTRLRDADLLAEKWMRSNYADIRMMGADLKQVLS
jgi:hypothetical protein